MGWARPPDPDAVLRGASEEVGLKGGDPVATNRSAVLGLPCRLYAVTRGA